MTTKNQFIYTAITGSDWVTGAYVGAENDDWRERDSRTEAESYLNAIIAGDLGADLIADLESCEGEIDLTEVATMLDSRKD